MMTGTMFFITSVGCMMPMDAMPTAGRQQQRWAGGGDDSGASECECNRRARIE